MASSQNLPKNTHFLSSLRVQGLLAIGAALLCIGLFLKVTWELHESSKLSSLDQQILVLISKLRMAPLNGSAVDMTALGSPTVIALFTIIGTVLFWLNRNLRECLYLVTSSIGAGIATTIMKHLFTRERPTVVPMLVEVSGFSYPSGHSLVATSFLSHFDVHQLETFSFMALSGGYLPLRCNFDFREFAFLDSILASIILVMFSVESALVPLGCVY